MRIFCVHVEVGSRRQLTMRSDPSGFGSETQKTTSSGMWVAKHLWMTYIIQTSVRRTKKGGRHPLLLYPARHGETLAASRIICQVRIQGNNRLPPLSRSNGTGTSISFWPPHSKLRSCATAWRRRKRSKSCLTRTRKRGSRVAWRIRELQNGLLGGSSGSVLMGQNILDDTGDCVAWDEAHQAQALGMPTDQYIAGKNKRSA